MIDEAYLEHPVAVPTIDLGFNDDPDRKYIELPIPDTSNPPFRPRKTGYKRTGCPWPDDPGNGKHVDQQNPESGNLERGRLR